VVAERLPHRVPRRRRAARGGRRWNRPDGRWLLVAWPLADQWVYLRPGTTGATRVRGALEVSKRFKTSGFPQLGGWCCPP
jgi:hypothetical protein